MTNHNRKILNYIYKKHTVSYLDLKKRFKGKISIEDLQQLMCQQYIEKSGGNMTVYGGPSRYRYQFHLLSRSTWYCRSRKQTMGSICSLFYCRSSSPL